MSNVTRSDIAATRRTVEEATTEIDRWGMVLSALTENRRGLERGVVDAPNEAVALRFERLLTGGEATPTTDRPAQLAYLTEATIRNGPGSGGTFFEHAGSVSGLGSFPETFRSYVSGESDQPTHGDVLAAFESEALRPAVSAYDADESRLETLVDLVEAGQRAAKAYRDAAVARLNNSFDDEGTPTEAGLIQRYHRAAGSDGSTDSDVTGGVATTAPDAAAGLQQYGALFSDLDERPAVLLPVGLETRFLGSDDDRTGDSDELWVRVYPDDLHVDVHEEPLTPQEERWGRTFWTQVYVARFPVADPDGSRPRERFYVDPATKLPDDPAVVEELAHLFYDTGDGTTVDDFSREGAERYREVKERAWGQLVERAGQERAAYVAHRTAPVDGSEGDAPETATAILSGAIATSASSAADRTKAAREADDLSFPEVEHRPGSWTRQPRARFLPDRWLAMVEWTDDDGTDQSAVVVARHTVREPLFMGPNPESVAVATHDPGAGDDGTRRAASATDAVADGMEWMVDFEEAERAGMAFRVTPADLGVSTLPDHFDRVVVTGLKTSMGPDDSAAALRELVDVHHYTRGLELLPEGTPTNNHEGDSGYRRDRDHLETVDTEVAEPVTRPGEPTDGNLLANALGLGQPADEAHPFAHVAGADRTEWLDAYHMHSVLWPGTIGHYLRHVLTPGRYLEDGEDDDVWSVWSEDASLLTDVRDHFLRFVRGGGPLPTLRIGSQPYGVLPATAVDRHGTPPDDDTTAVYWFLLRAVTVIRRFWERSVGNVPRVNPERAADASAEGTSWEASGGIHAAHLDVFAGSRAGDDSPSSDDDGNGISPSGGDDGNSDAMDVVEAVLMQDAISNTFKHRPYYLEDTTGGYRYAGLGTSPYDALKQVGIGFDPRITRFNLMRVLPNRDRFPYHDMVAGRKSLDPIPNPVVATESYLDRLSRVTTADLVRLGYDLKLRRFPYIYRDAYTLFGSAENWDAFSTLFHGERPALKSWVQGGDKPSQITRLDALFDTDAEDFFVEPASYVGPGSVEMPPRTPTIESAVEQVLGTAHGDPAKDRTTLILLLVDALDEWLGESESMRELTLTAGPNSGETVELNTVRQDGHERLPSSLEDLQLSIVSDLRDRAINLEQGWPDGRAKLEELFHALTSAVRANMDLSFAHEESRPEIREVVSTLRHANDVTAHGGVYAVNGEAFDRDEMELSGGTRRYILAGQLVNQNRAVFNAALSLMEGLLAVHTENYLILAFTLKRETSGPTSAETEEAEEGGGDGEGSESGGQLGLIDPGGAMIDPGEFSTELEGPWKGSWDTWRADGASAVPTGENAPLELKVDRDTSLFNLVVWYAAINARLNVVERAERRMLAPADVLIGDRGRSQAKTAYDLLDMETDGRFDRFTASYGSTSVRNSFGAHRWFGLLDAMRFDVGNDATDERFAAFQASLRWMANEGWLTDDTEGVESLFASALDVSSHRLDAWWTSLGTRRLAEIRSESGTGGKAGGFDVDAANAWVDTSVTESPIYELPDEASTAWSLPAPDGDRGSYIGAYGVVENLERDRDEAREEYEYIQSPSIPHATTAAILRSGYRSHPSSDFRETMKIDLSPGRVRSARWVLRGLRQGLWLGELLGYHVERRLHQVSRARTDVDLEQYITEFRAEWPFSEGKIHDSQDRERPSLQADPIDGYALYQTAAKQGLAHVFEQVGVSNAHQQAVRDVLRELAELVDSVGDLVTAENVHQLQQGNYSQAGRSLSALAEGKPPRDPDVVRPHREHVGVTHRLLLLTGLGTDPGEADLDPPSPWQVSDTVTTPVVADDGSVETNEAGSPVTTKEPLAVRDDGAPVLNELAGRLFPDPDRVTCVATYRWTTGDDAGATTDHSVETPVTLADLRLTPVDALWLTQRSGEAGASKLESHVAYHLLRTRPDRTPPIPADATLDVAFEETPGSAPAGAISFGDFVELSRSLRDLLGEGRPADGTDLAHPGDDETGERVEPPLGDAAATRKTLENVGRVLENRLGLLASVESPEAAFRTEGGRSGSDGGSSGTSQPGANGPNGSTDDALTTDVDRIQSRLDAFASRSSLSSVDEEAGSLSASTFLTELEAVERRLAAGPTNPDEIEADLVVTPGTASVDGSIPDGEDVDVYLPADDLRVEAALPDGGSAGRVVVTDERGHPLAEVSPTTSGNTLAAEVDFNDVLDGRFPVRRVDVRLVDSDAELTAITGQNAPGSGSYGSRVRAVVALPELVGPLRNDSLTVTLRVESDSPAVRVRRSVQGVAVGADGTYEAAVDLGDVPAGTAFEAVALAEVDGSVSPVVDSRDGRVAGDDGAVGVDDEFVRSLSVVPRLLWLDARADAFAVEMGSADGTPETDAERLRQALQTADWSAIERESALMPSPSSETTFDAADEAAVRSLIGLADVDMRALAETLTSPNRPRGLVTLVRRLGLSDAITMVGTDAPFGDDRQSYYGSDGAAQGEARALVRAFRRNPWPSDAHWRSGPLLVDGDLFAFVTEQGAEEPLDRLLSLVRDDAWTVEHLAHLTDEPVEVVRDVNDVLFHPEAMDTEDYTAAASRLERLASNVAAATDDPDVRNRVEAFDTVGDPEAHFASPLAALARLLASYSAGGRAAVDPQTGRNEFVDVFDGVVQALRQQTGPLATADEGGDVGEAFREGLLETVRRQLRRAAYFGIYGAMPSGGGRTLTDERNLVRTAETVVETIDERLAAYHAVEADDPVDVEVDRRKALFGDEFETLPPFRPANVRELGRTFGDQAALLDHESAGPLPVQTWLQRSARVRERPRMLRETLTYADIVADDDSDHLALDVGQLPHYPDDDWVGIDGVVPSVNDRVSVVAHTDDGFDQVVSSAGGGSIPQVAGVFVDEWEERVPAAEETTAVSFRYDDPANRPPQSIVLATPPKRADGPAWTLSDLLGTVEETMEMAKYRAVDLEALAPENDPDRTAAGTLFPGLFFAHDTHLQPNHPTVDFTPLELASEFQVLATLPSLGEHVRRTIDLLGDGTFAGGTTGGGGTGGATNGGEE